MDAEIVRNFLFLNGYVYYHSRYCGARRHWECRRIRTKECTARAIANIPAAGAEIIIFKGIAQSPHKHPPNHNECKAEKVKMNLKRKADEHPEQPPVQLLRTELSNLPAGVLCQLPSRENLSKAVRRGPRKSFPQNPTALDDFKIPIRYQRTLTDEKFMIFDSGYSDDGRVLVFGTQRNLQLLNKSTVWFLDGTFKVAPTIFTILGTREKQKNSEDQEIVPISYVYALLSSKTETQYTSVLRAVHSRLLLTCCFFLLKQSLYRKIQQESLQVRYNDAKDETIRLQTHMIAALAFVPTDEVSRVFGMLEDEVDEDLIPILHYFREIYVFGRSAKGRRKAVPPCYPPALWNQYDAALTGEKNE